MGKKAILHKDQYGVSEQRIFSWKPRRLEDGSWVWLRRITRRTYSR